MGIRLPRHLEIYRRKLYGEFGDAHNFQLVIPNRGLAIIGSDGEGWDHVSVSCKDRTPTWEEMEWVKRELFEEGDCVMQLHVPVADHKNHCPFCLHMWRPQRAEIPRPPAFMVAP